MSESIKKIVMISVCIVISFFMSMIVVNTIPVMASTGTVPALKGTYYQSADSSRYIVVQTTDMQCYKVKSGSFRFSAVDGTGHIGINATVSKPSDAVEVLYTGYLKYYSDGTYWTNMPNSDIYASGTANINGYMTINSETYYK